MNERIELLQSRIRAFNQARNWGQFHSPKNLATAIAVEASELLEVFAWLTPHQSDVLTPRQMKQVEEEVGDVLILLLGFCDRIGLDPVSCAEEKLKINGKRYPVSKAYGKADSVGNVDEYGVS